MRELHESCHEFFMRTRKKMEGLPMDQQETTLAQLVMEYGAQEFLYIVLLR